MSYVSLLRTIPGLLSQPTGIAAIASVGIHGAIAFILPLVPLGSNTKEAKNTKTVGLVELTQADQQRLPQTNPSSTAIKTLPALPTQGVGALPDALKENTPLPTPSQASIPPTGLFLPPLPQSPENLNVGRLPSSRGSASKQSSTRNQSSFNPVFSSGRTGNVRITRNPQGRNRSNFPIARSRNFQGGTVRPDLLRSLPSVKPGNFPTNLPSNPTRTNSNQTEISRLPQGVASPPETPTNSQANQNPNQVAPLGKIPQTGDNLTLARNSKFSGVSPNGSFGGSNVNPGNFTVNSGKKVLSEGELFVQAKKEFPQVETQLQPLAVKLNSPKESDKTTTVKGALVVDSNGRIDFFKLLDNSIPSNLKIAVRDHFKQYFQKNPVKKNGKPKYYSFNVAFEPSSGNSVVIPQVSNESVNSPENLKRRLQSIKNGRTSISTPSVNQNGANKPSNQQSVNLKPLRIQPQTSISPIEVKKPTPGAVEEKPSPKPVVVEKQPQQSLRQSKPSSSPKATLSQRLRNATESSQKKKPNTLRKKLRNIRQERETSE